VTLFNEFKKTISEFFDTFGKCQYSHCARIVSLSKKWVFSCLQNKSLFRFYGKISPESNVHEDNTIKAIKENMDGLQQISGERLWTEFKKILSGNYAEELTLKMLELGLAPYVGLPVNYDVEEFVAVSRRISSLNLPVNAITLLTGLLRTEEEVF